MPTMGPHHERMPPKKKKKAADRKSDTIKVRVTAEQRELFEAAAKRQGLDLSSWMRSIATIMANERGKLR